MTEERKSFRKTASIICFGFFAMILLTQLVQIFAVNILNNCFTDFASKNADILNNLLAIVPLYCFGLPMFLLITKNIKGVPAEKKDRKKMKIGDFLCLILICLAVCYIANYASIMINQIISAIKKSEVINPVEMFLKTNMWGVLIFSGIIAPIMEELVFRKILIDKLRPFGEGLCIFASGLIFSFVHGNLSQMLYAFALGVIFAFITLKTGTIIYSILLHMIINIFMGFISAQIVMSKNQVLMALMVVCVVIFFISGLILGLVNMKKVKINKPVGEISTKQYIGTFSWNLGMVFLMLITLTMIICTIML